MHRFVTSLFARKPATIRNAPAPARKTRLGVTALEDRNMPAFLSAGALMIEGTAPRLPTPRRVSRTNY